MTTGTADALHHPIADINHVSNNSQADIGADLNDKCIANAFHSPIADSNLT